MRFGLGVGTGVSLGPDISVAACGSGGTGGCGSLLGALSAAMSGSIPFS